MNEDVKAKWLGALRSGRYRQGKGGLRNEDTYCCLGVLCDVVNPSGWENRGDRVFPEPEVSRKAEIPWGYQTRLVRLNDGRGWTFDQIADYIEENL